MSARPVGAYRSLLWLYPRPFRVDYREDLLQHFADLVVDRGRRTAWARTTVDLIVTVPRYRLESIMSEPHTTTAITTNLRQRRLATAGVLAVISVGAIISYMQAVSAEHVSGLSLVLHNAIGVPAMVGAVIFLVVGLLTPSARGSELGSTPAT